MLLATAGESPEHGGIGSSVLQNPARNCWERTKKPSNCRDWQQILLSPGTGTIPGAAAGRRHTRVSVVGRSVRAFSRAHWHAGPTGCCARAVVRRGAQSRVSSSDGGRREGRADGHLHRRPCQRRVACGVTSGPDGDGFFFFFIYDSRPGRGKNLFICTHARPLKTPHTHTTHIISIQINLPLHSDFNAHSTHTSLASPVYK